MNCLNGVFVLKPNKNIELALMQGLVMKKSRGDKTAIELFLSEIRSWDAGLRRNLNTDLRFG